MARSMAFCEVQSAIQMMQSGICNPMTISRLVEALEDNRLELEDFGIKGNLCDFVYQCHFEAAGRWLEVMRQMSLPYTAEQVQCSGVLSRLTRLTRKARAMSAKVRFTLNPFVPEPLALREFNKHVQLGGLCLVDLGTDVFEINFFKQVLSE